jgi:hypothetical protein
MKKNGIIRITVRGAQTSRMGQFLVEAARFGTIRSIWVSPEFENSPY